MKLRETLSFSAAPVSAVADEPLPAVRVAGIAARFGDFYAGSSRANSPGVVSHSRDQQLRSCDVVADGIRVAAVNSGGISQAGEPANYARAFTASPVSTLHLSLARARYDFRIGEPILASAEANHVLAQLKSASERADKLLDAWDAGWLQLLSQDVGAFLNHSRQGWRMSRDFADGGSKRISWLLVFDGLRYDLWQSILAPAIKRAGWRVPDSDTSFAFLPSVTEVSRWTVIGGSPDAARGQEAAKAKTLAERAGAKLTYQVRTEAFDKEREDVEGWNVRVFS